MAETVRELMSTNVITVPESGSVQEAAALMRDQSIGDVVVAQDSKLVGVLTDRDLVVRVVAEGADPGEMTVGEVCSNEIVTVGPDDSLKQAVSLVRKHAVRRLPVVEDGKLVGILSMGDLAIEREEQSALADVSAATPNI